VSSCKNGAPLCHRGGGAQRRHCGMAGTGIAPAGQVPKLCHFSQSGGRRLIRRICRANLSADFIRVNIAPLAPTEARRASLATRGMHSLSARRAACAGFATGNTALRRLKRRYQTARPSAPSEQPLFNPHYPIHRRCPQA